MNWKRIMQGGLIGAGWVYVIDAVSLGLLSRWVMGRGFPWMILIYLILPSLLVGFLLSVMYAMARPRLGPGPKTALIVGTAAMGLIQSAMIFNWMSWKSNFSVMALQLFLSWFKCVGATYLAGWHYIEKSPE